MRAPTVVRMSRGHTGTHDVGSGWPAYIEAALADLEWSNGALADAVGCHQTLIGRWISGAAHPSVVSVRQVCRVLGTDIREGLIAAGILSRAELRMTWTGPGRPELELFHDDELIAEVMRRLAEKNGGVVPPGA